MNRKNDIFKLDEEWYVDYYHDVKLLNLPANFHYKKYGVFLRRFKSEIHKFSESMMLSNFYYNQIKWNGKSQYDAFKVNTAIEGKSDYKLQDGFEILLINSFSMISHQDWIGYVNDYLPHDSTVKLLSENSDEPFSFKNIKFESSNKIEDGPLVTVIIPAFNAEKTIEYSVNSVLEQSWKNLEILIFDDCSSDGTADKIKELAKKDNRIRFFSNTSNVGPYVTKNIALLFSNGEYITCHDADDISHPQRIEKHINIFFENFESMKVSMLSLLRVSESGRICRITKTGKYTPDGILRASPISCMFDKNFLVDELGGWDCVKAGGDSELIDRCEKVLGYEVPKFNVLSMICLESEGSLTQNNVIGINAKNSPRKEYVKNYRLKHSSAEFKSLKSFPPSENDVDIPDALAVDHKVVSDLVEQYEKYNITDNNYVNTKLYIEAVKNLERIFSVRGYESLKNTIITNRSFSSIEVALAHVCGINISYNSFCYLAKFKDSFYSLFSKKLEKLNSLYELLLDVYFILGVTQKEIPVLSRIFDQNLNLSKIAKGRQFQEIKEIKREVLQNQNKIDVALVGDWCKFGGPQKSMLQEIEALTLAGLKVGVCHMQALRFMQEKNLNLNASIKKLISNGEVEYIDLEKPYEVGLLVLRYPPILQFCTDFKSNWKVGEGIILANQSPHELDFTDVRYDVNTVQRNFKKLFSIDPLWAPMGPMVKNILANYLPQSFFTENIPGIINFKKESIKRERFLKSVPKKIGRYSRDNLMKFPGDSKIMSLAYMANNENYEVLIMGGVKAVNDIFNDNVPNNWSLIKYKGMPVKKFSKEAYSFVYFDNDQIVEAFGRSILEAIASGCMVILPKKYEVVFGDAAVYCDYDEVRSIIDFYSSNPSLYLDKVKECLDSAVSDFGYGQYVTFIKKMQGAL